MRSSLESLEYLNLYLAVKAQEQLLNELNKFKKQM